MRRFLIILLVILLVGAGIWFFYLKPKQSSGVSPVPNILKPFFPTSTSNGNSFGTDTGVLNGPTTNNSTSTSPQPAFKQVSARPVAGYTIFSQTNTVSIPSTPITTKPSSGKTALPATKPIVQTTTDHVLRYISRINGYVYEIRNNSVPLQITNILIPNVYEATFADANNTAVERFLRADNETIATYTLPIPPLNSDGTRTQKTGTYLPDNIYNLAVSPDQKQIARVTADQTGGIVSLSNSIGTQIKTVIRSPFVEWLPLWSGNTLYIQTKATGTANGFLYSVNQATSRLQKVIGDVPGLTVSISPSGAYVLYSESTAGGFVTKILNTKTNSITNLGLVILPEKCAWLQNEDLICAGNSSVPNNTYPDDWYAGVMHFSDQLYHIATKSNTYVVLYGGQQQSFDMTNLQVDEGQQIVYFIDKTTGYLWQMSY
jgi:hypothetical protein